MQALLRFADGLQWNLLHARKQAATGSRRPVFAIMRAALAQSLIQPQAALFGLRIVLDVTFAVEDQRGAIVEIVLRPQ